MDKKPLLKLSKIILVLLLVIVFLNLPVSSRQGVNYQLREIKMPLYIKIIEFFDRNYHYKEITKRITRGCNSDEEKVLALFKWTHQTIKTNIPEGWPIVDDHVWHIIVRGYGVKDQSSDVFTTLCNYAGVDAFFTCVYTVDRTKRIPLSFVKIEGRWSVFDPYYGNYFKNKNGEIADIEEIKSEATWFVESLDEKPDIDYTVYLDNLPSVKDVGLTRANIQSPLNRLRFEIKKWLK